MCVCVRAWEEEQRAKEGVEIGGWGARDTQPSFVGVALCRPVLRLG